jgi:hypothetical protein
MCPHRLSFTDYIKVLIGQQAKLFNVHKNIICNRAPFYKAACAPCWTEASQPIKLPEDDPEIFDIYLHCVYTNCVDVGDLNDILAGEECSAKNMRPYRRLVRSYILADRLGDIITANMIIDEIILHSDDQLTLPSDDVIAFVAQTMPLQSPLCRLFVDYFVHEANAESIQHAFKDGKLPQPFF